MSETDQDSTPPDSAAEVETDATDSSVADSVKAAAGSVVDAASGAVSKVVDTVKSAVGGDDADDSDSASERTSRKVREGIVVSNKMDKTAVVAVVSRAPHPKYKKMILQTNKLYAHDETNDVNIGDRVRVMETRALSKKKRWRITDVLERAK